jgi:outer membrane receptor protein involved in Fe transport
MRFLTSSLLLALMSAALLSGVCAAQESPFEPTLTGIVRDAQSNERLPYTSIAIKGTKFGTRSNLEGVFTLKNAPDSTFTLVAQRLGYKPAEVKVNPHAQQGAIIIAMTQSDVKTRQITVTGEQTRFLQAEKQPSLTVIAPKQLATLPSIGQVDIFRSLQLLPGISGTSDGTAGLFVRGGTPDQNLVLFDGMTVYHVDHFFGFFSAFNPDAVKDIQFYKGGFPAQYGGRLSSVVDMTGKTGSSKGFHANLNANLLSLSGTVEFPLWDKGTFLAAFRRSYKLFSYDTFYNALTGGNSNQRLSVGNSNGPPIGGVFANETPDSYFYDLNVKATLNLTPKDILSVSVFNSSDDVDKSQDFSRLQLPGGVNLGNFSPPKITDYNTQGNIGASVKLFHQWDGGLSTNALLAFSRYTSAFKFGIERGANDNSTQNSSTGGPPRFSSDENNSASDVTLRVDNYWTYSREHELTFGGQLSLIGSSYKLNLPRAFSGSTETLDVSESAFHTSLYAQDKWKPLDNLDVTFGLRANHYSSTGGVYLEPRASARYVLSSSAGGSVGGKAGSPSSGDVSGEWAIKAAVGRYYQFVNRIVNENLTQGSRDFWTLADSKLDPSSANHFIAGFTWENDQFLVDVEGYYKQLFDLVEFSQRFRRTADDKYNFFAGNGSSRGIEVLLQKKQGWLTGWISYTLSRTESYFPDISANPFAAVQDQLHELKTVLSADLGADWTLSTVFIYGSGKPYTSPVSQYTLNLLGDASSSYVHIGEKNGYRLPAYHRLDVSISKLMSSSDDPLKIRAGLSLFNLYNHKNVSYYRYDFSSTPVLITEVTGLGLTPTLFLNFEF